MAKKILGFLIFPILNLTTSCQSSQENRPIIIDHQMPSHQKEDLSKKSLSEFIDKFTYHKPIKMNTSDKDIFNQTLSKGFPDNSPEEAVVVLGIVHTWFQELANLRIQNKNRINTQSIYDEKNFKRAKELNSIEVQLGKYGVKLSKSLNHNSYLQKYPLQILIFKVLKYGKQSEDFVEEVKLSLIENVKKTGKDVHSFQVKLSQIRSKEGLSNIQIEQKEEGIGPALTFEGALLDKDEEVFQAAQELVNRKSYKDAKVKLMSIDKNSLYYEASVEKIQMISNLAVLDLRRKAAKAFQSAKPIADRKTRAAYLSQAKNYLVDAISSFPDSDQINTVEENLKVINKSIQAIGYQEEDSGDHDS